MFNEAHVSLVGYVASEPKLLTVGENNVPKLTVRVCWTNRRRDSATGEWIDGNTSFVNVICWRQLADNLSACLRKGDPVLVRGRLDVRSFVGRDGVRRTAVDVDANALGPDLNRGVAGFRRIWPPSGKTADEQQVATGQSGDGGEVAADDEALAAMAETGLPSAAEAPAGEDMFDDSAIEALAQEADSVTAPF